MRVNNQDRLHAWMGNNAIIGNLPINKLVLPGSHDSGSTKERRDQMQLPHEVTQDVSLIKQIRGGIRVLDLRVHCCEQFRPGDPRRFQLRHFTSTGVSLEADLLEPLLDYFKAADTQKEIIILDFHELHGFTSAIHQEFQAMLIGRLGPRCLPADVLGKNLVHLWLNHPGKNLVLAYAGPAFHPSFCNAVTQRWSGSNTNTTATLKTFMDEVAEEWKPNGQLRAIQCAKYALPLFVPDDFSNKIDQWFHSEDENSYIQKFYIINTDWSLRSRIVANCIHASVVRAMNA
ncbi:hypothetical protein [Pseudomonas sp.]|uniref:hypothetical protein n=1 Tax=Pseudomonas sp. TaxID=306 RepID=UPI002584D10D|nr:hypothetical protein [Pseudomonas sp.]